MTSAWTALAAISPNHSLAVQTSPLGGCGRCVEVQPLCGADAGSDCAVPKVVALIASTCASCGPTDISLSQDAFQQLGGSLSAGRLPITYRAVPCAPPSNLSVGVLDYRTSGGGYLRLVPLYVAGSDGVASVELRQTPLVGGRLDMVASAWRKLHNMYGATWELSGLPAPPLDLRLTDGKGRLVLARQAITVAGKLGVLQTAVQFLSSSEAAGIAAAEQAALALPEMAALAEQAGLAQAGDRTAAAATADSPVLSPAPSPLEATGTAPAPAAGDAQLAAGVNAEAAAEVAELQALQEETAAAAGSSCENATVLDLLAGERSFSILLDLIRTAGLEGAFIDPSTALTNFAPTNSAWRAAVQHDPLLRLGGEALLRTVLLQHMLLGARQAADFSAQMGRYDTLAGGFLSIKSAPGATTSNDTSATAAPAPASDSADSSSSGGGGQRLLVVSQASVAGTLATNLRACSSVVHAVDTVLMPSDSASWRRRRRS
ncbi:hypothetical protein ABPG75_003014 [Micractinium tetrahymenae]